MDLAQTIALSAGLAWASGLRLYLVVFLAGALAHLGYLHLPSTLAVLQHPLVIGVAGVMAFAELVADKIPAFDSLWDGFQTFVRIPAGALLAAFALAEELKQSQALTSRLVEFAAQRGELLNQ